MTDQFFLVVVKRTLTGFVLSWVATAAFAQGPGAIVESQPVVRAGRARAESDEEWGLGRGGEGV